ncbi:hypothetical protein QBC45DRAFT_478283 [Copromyces sp. CBS 386.78]|nr:hypothetical protein QBC45DRAFT_478283 [Copromyces sp. CBS 386.78]
MTISLIAFIYPKEDKVERLKEICKETAEWVQANEPGCLQYHWSQSTEDDKPVFVVQESYADMAAVEAHKNSEKFAWLIELGQKEDLMAKPLKGRRLFTKRQDIECKKGTNGGSREKSMSANRLSLVCRRGNLDATEEDCRLDKTIPEASGRELGEECGASGSSSGESRTGEWNLKKHNPGVNSTWEVPLGAPGGSQGSWTGVAPNEVIGLQFFSQC